MFLLQAEEARAAARPRLGSFRTRRGQSWDSVLARGGVKRSSTRGEDGGWDFTEALFRRAPGAEVSAASGLSVWELVPSAFAFGC